MPRNRANLTGIQRRERQSVNVVITRPTDPGTIGGADPGTVDSSVATLGHYEEYGGGSNQAFTASLAAILPGGADPLVVIETPGRYLLLAFLQLEAIGATATTQTVTFELGRQNNTPASVSNSTVTIDLPAMTTATQTIGSYALPAVQYVTTNDDDEIVIQGLLSSALGAGTIEASLASITAIRIA